MLLVQPPVFGPGTGPRLGVGVPLCFDYADFDADSEVGYRFQHQHQRNPQCERERYFNENNGIGGGKTPVIVSATMSVVDFGGGTGGGCLGFGPGFGGGAAAAATTTPDYTGCGTLGLGLGRRGSLPLAAEFGVSSTGPGTAPSSPLASSFFPRELGRTEDEHQHEHKHQQHTNLTSTRRQSTPLALFARIKKQLSGTSMDAGERRASSDGYVSGWKENRRGEKEKERRGSGMTAAMTMMAAMYVGADAGGSGDSRWKEGDPTDVFSTTDQATKPASLSLSSSTSAKRNQRRRRQRKQHRVSGSGTDTQHNAEADAAFSSPSVYSCSSASRRSSSFIGSSASFLELERDNMKESRDRAEFIMMHPRAHLPLDEDHDRDDSGYGRSFYYDCNTHTHITIDDNENGGYDDMSSMYTANTEGTRSSAGSYVPYLPLVIQHERLQKKLRVPLSLDAVSATAIEVGSASASVVSRDSRSLAPRASEGSNGGVSSVSMRSGSGSGSRERQKGGRRRPRTPRKEDAPPPLPASSVTPPRSTPSISPLRNARASNSQSHVMGTGTDMPSSPTSPTSSTDTSESMRSPVTPNTPRFFGAPAVEDGVDLKRDSRGKGVHDLEHHYYNQPSDAPGFVQSRSEEKRQSILVHKDVNVNVLPPTPTTLNGFGSDGSQQQSSSTSSSPPSPPSHQSQSQSPLNRARSRSRQNLGKAPPPPSGPLPLPPQSRNPSQTRTERTEQPSPHSSFELGFPTPHRHPSPFGFRSDKGSGDTTPTASTTVTKMLKTKAKATMTTMAMTMAKGSGGAGKDVFVDTGSELRFVVVDKEEEDEDGVNEMILGPLYTSESDSAPSAHAYSYSYSHSHKPSSELTPVSAVVAPDAPQQIDIDIDVFALHEERLKRAAETEKIGVGRQQVQQQRRQRRSCREETQPQVQPQELEWTLCLGADAPTPPAALPSSGPALSSSSSCMIPEVTLTLSPSPSSSSTRSPPPPLQPLPPLPTPRSSPLSSHTEPTPTQLRMRTKSEPALGRKAAQGPAPGQDWTLMLPLPAVPLLPTQLKSAATAAMSSPLSSSPLLPSSSKTPTTTKERYSDPTPSVLGAGPFEDDTSSVDFSTDLHVPSASVDSHTHADARMGPILDDAQDNMLCVPTHGNTNTVGGRKSPNQNPNRVEEIVLCVPRLVTHGSASRTSTTPMLTDRERGCKPKSKSKPKFKDGAAARVAFDVDVNDDEYDDDDGPADAHHLEAPNRQPNRTKKRSSKLAKLDALSADLARFNEMLRSASASSAGAGVAGHFHHHSSSTSSTIDSGFLHGAPGVGSGVVCGGVNVNVGGGAKPNANATAPMSAKRQHQQQQLKHTRSYGILEVDEPPPPHAILRVPSVGDLFLDAEGSGARSRVDSKATARVRVRSDSKARVKAGKEVVEYVKDDVSVTPEEEDATSRERVSMGSIVSSASSMSATSRMSPNPFDAPLTPTSPSPTTPTLVAAPPTRTSVQSFASLNSQRSRASLSSLSSTASGSTQPPPTKIRPPLPFAPPVAFGGYAAAPGRSPTSTSTLCSVGNGKNAGVGVGSNTNATSRKLSSASLSSVSPSTTSKHMAAKDEKGMRSSASTGLLRRGTTRGTGMGGENEKGCLRGRAGSLGLRVVVDSMKRVDGPGDIVLAGGEAEGETEVKVNARLSSSSDISTTTTSRTTPTSTQSQTTIWTTSSPVPADALRVDTSSLSLLSFPSNSTLRPMSSSVSSGSGSSIKSSRSSGSLTPTASPKSESKHMLPHLYPRMQLSPEEVEDDYYESESAGPTPLASSFPVPPAFPTLRSSLSTSTSLSTSITNTNLITEVHPVAGNTDANVNANDNANDHARPGPAAVKYHAPGTGDSTRSARTITPLHFRGLNLEERIRQLRVLEVDAAGADTPDSVGREKERGMKREAVAVVEKEKESDDEESLCSEAYYSARSSFSSERVG